MRHDSRIRNLRPEDLAGLRWRGYIRESTQTQADRGTPPERQRADIARAAADLGMVQAPDPLFYERVGSGEKESVPELRRALDDGIAGQYQVLVVFHSSRWARNRYEAITMKRAFSAAGIFLYFASQRLISGTYAGALSEGISEVVDEHANAERRMFIAGGLRERQLSGRWTGRIPTGYRRRLADFADGTRGWDGGLEIDPDTAAVVRSIFEQSAAGASPRRIAVALNTAGSRRVRGGPWVPDAVSGIVENPAYKGDHVRYQRDRAQHYYPADDAHDGRRVISRAIPAIVDERLWAAAQRIPAPGAVKEFPKTVYALSGVAKCARCGWRMTGTANGKTTGSTRYYRCGGRLVGVCDAAYVRADRVEGDFSDWLGSIRLPADWRSALARLEVKAVAAGERDRVKGIDDRIARLRNLYAWGDISEADYREQVSRLRADAVVMARPDMAGLESVASLLADVGDVWRRLPAGKRRDIPRKMLQSVLIDGEQPVVFVARPELRPLLELGVVQTADLYSGGLDYTVRYSA